MKSMTKLLALALVLMMVLSMAPVTMAEEAAEAAAPTAYLMYANADWSVAYMDPGAALPEGAKAIEAQVTGEGDYTVGLDFTGMEGGASAGLAFTAVGISNGENAFPGYDIRINEVRVNGKAIKLDKGYTSSDDRVTTRYNLYNEWVNELPSDARSYDGYLTDVIVEDGVLVVDKADFESVQTVEVDFTYFRYGLSTAYIMFADGSWERQYWLDGNEYGGVVATNVDITEPGSYTVGLDFTGTDYGKAEGVAFTALGINHAENIFPRMRIEITDIRLNGESVAFGKGYTSSDADGQFTTRMNVFNEWVPEVPNDASVRSFDGSVEGASAQMVDKELFGEVFTYEIDFTLHPVTDTAFLMFADSTWAVSAWNPGEYAETNAVTVDGPGTYTLALDFSEVEGGELAGFAFIAAGIANGETSFPGYFMNVTDIKVNGEAIEIGKDFTTTDEGITTRSNIWNEWVTDLPKEARRADGDLEGATAMIASTEALSGVKTIEVTFDYIYGEPIDNGEPPYTEEEAAAVKAADYNAYIGVQSETYIFRNGWNDNYGRDDAEHEGYFNRLTGWDGDLAVDYAGTFEDAAITADGTYTVSLTTGEMGFGSDGKFNLLFVSTDIPGKAVREGVITISDVTVKFGENGRTQEYGEIKADGDYVMITILDSYNQSSEPVAYTVPGANETITITFTVSGLTD